VAAEIGSQSEPFQLGVERDADYQTQQWSWNDTTGTARTFGPSNSGIQVPTAWPQGGPAPAALPWPAASE
jgi:hypothetical protein